MKLLCLLFCGLFLVTTHAKASLTEPSSNTHCGPLVRNQIFHRSQLEGGVRFYYLYATVDNSSPTSSWGGKMVFLKAHENPGLTYGESLPILMNKSQVAKIMYFARSSQRFSGITTNNTVNVSNMPYFRDNTVFDYCAPLGPLDLLFSAQRNRNYRLQRSDDLVDWPIFETLRLPPSPQLTELVAWRSQYVMETTPHLAREFYRADAECSNATDCQTESLRLKKSQVDLNNTYR